MPTTTQLQVMVGKTGLARLEKLLVPVHIKDSRYVFGRTDLLITPLNGKGEKWIIASDVTVENNA